LCVRPAADLRRSIVAGWRRPEHPRRDGCRHRLEVDALAVEAGLEAVTPARYNHRAHHWLILHGRYVCKARKPDCPVCIVADLCRYGAKTGPAEMIAARAETATPAPLVEPSLSPRRARRK